MLHITDHLQDIFQPPKIGGVLSKFHHIFRCQQLSKQLLKEVYVTCEQLSIIQNLWGQNLLEAKVCGQEFTLDAKLIPIVVVSKGKRDGLVCLGSRPCMPEDMRLSDFFLLFNNTGLG